MTEELIIRKTGIGFFPDVGGGRYLSRLTKRLWQFLTLTVARLDAAACKEMVNAAFENNLEQGLVHERRLFKILTATEDKKEGMAAFIEKREGQWRGQ